jgi:hypothetical protein
MTELKCAGGNAVSQLYHYQVSAGIASSGRYEEMNNYVSFNFKQAIPFTNSK